MEQPKIARSSSRRELAQEVDRRLAGRFPDAHCELDYETPWQLLVATVLSAQTTDVRVNQVTKILFTRWSTPQAMAAAAQQEVQEVLRPLGFTTRRARHVIELSAQLLDSFGGQVPRSRDELVTLPGVGRKTAHVVLAEAFGLGYLAVDTHVMRTAHRIGLTDNKDPLKVEHDLVELYDAGQLPMVSHRLIFLGRRICHARTPQCEVCPLRDICRYAMAAELSH